MRMRCSSSSSGASNGRLPRPVSAEERPQRVMCHKAHLSIVKGWARKAAAAGLKVKMPGGGCGRRSRGGRWGFNRLQHVYERVYRQ